MIFVLCGLPGSGKTTKAKQLQLLFPEIKLYSFDDMPGACHPKYHNQSYEDIIMNIKQDLLHKQIVIYDNLNLTKESRINLLSQLKNLKCFTVLIVMNTPVEKCVYNNKIRRQMKLSDAAIYNLNLKFEPPSYDEGWDEIYYCYEKESELL